MRELILEHYAEHPLAWPPRDYEQPISKPGWWGQGPKPCGLWVSVKGEADWPSWCEGENFRTEQLATCTRVHLAPDAKIKLISSGPEIVAFHDEYGVEEALSEGVTMGGIDWRKLATEYDGIIIAPYLWDHRLGDAPHTKAWQISNWYYPWDCASGCIWNGKAIASFEVMEHAKEEG